MYDQWIWAPSPYIKVKRIGFEDIQGDPESRFKDLMDHDDLQWRSFYRGWVEARLDMMHHFVPDEPCEKKYRRIHIWTKPISGLKIRLARLRAWWECVGISEGC